MVWPPVVAGTGGHRGTHHCTTRSAAKLKNEAQISDEYQKCTFQKCTKHMDLLPYASVFRMPFGLL